MPLNKVQLTINSRMYTVVSDESPEYMEMLGNHINEKVSAVISDGRHIMGERPMVLAALNICDEYYKLAAEKSSFDTNELSSLKSENEKLKNVVDVLNREIDNLGDENDKLRADINSSMEAQVIEKTMSIRNELDDAHTQIKFLEGQIKELEEKNEKMKQDHERREQEIFDMFKSGESKPQSSGKKSKKNKR